MNPALPIPPQPKSGCLTTAIFALLFLAGALVLWQFFYEPFSLLIRSERWDKVPCVIDVSRIMPAQQPNPNHPVRRRLDIQYHYSYKDAPRKSNRIWFIQPEPDDVEYLDRYPVKKSTFCYVDPQNPQIAVLERDFKPYLLVAIFPLAVSLIGIIGLLSQAIGAFHHEVRSARRAAMPRPHFLSQADRAVAAPAGALVHKVRARVGGFFIIALFAVIWNAGISFLVREVIASWSDGLPGCHGIFLTLFSIPFVLIGVASVLVAIYLLLKTFTPRPTLIISSAAAPLGSDIEVSWRFSRGIGQIRRLGVYLEGREEATYLHDDATRTESEVFVTVTLADSTDPAAIRGGQAGSAIPAGAAPSFKSDHNRIIWTIRIAGDVRFWPDVHEEVEITVLPLPAVASAVAGG